MPKFTRPQEISQASNLVDSLETALIYIIRNLDYEIGATLERVSSCRGVEIADAMEEIDGLSRDLREQVQAYRGAGNMRALIEDRHQDVVHALAKILDRPIQVAAAAE